MENQNGYTIHLQQFEGPFDLLLFFIQRDEIDIYDIPISKVTDDYLQYITGLEDLNIDVASEFILMAATLMRIKAKLLLPRKELDEEGNEIDPRMDLVQQLIEYKRYKSVLDDLQALEEQRSKIHHRASASKELRKIAEKALVDVEMESITLFKLLKAFESVVSRFDERSKEKIHTVVRYNYNVDDQKDFIIKKIAIGKKANFKAVFGEMKNRIHAVVTFLALLELLNLEKIRIVIGEGTNNFWLTKVGKQN